MLLNATRMTARSVEGTVPFTSALTVDSSLNVTVRLFAPIDLDAIDPDLLSAREKKMLNDYHKMVYDTISPYMTAEENEWLKRYTRAI